MSGVISRAQFLRGDFTNRRAPMRPPWSMDEPAFIETCTQCNQCIDKCPEKILKTGQGQLPEVDFATGECTFCYQCVEACESNALSGDQDTQPWLLKAEITKDCLVFKGIHCMTCRDQCETEAISFIPKVASPAYPVINPLLCNGCGACFQPCPNLSITINQQSTNQSAMSSHLKETAL